jgi:acyl dehydratase
MSCTRSRARCSGRRFPAPVPVGKRVRLTCKLVKLDEVPGGAQITIENTFEVEGGEKPVCVAESLARLYTG